MAGLRGIFLGLPGRFFFCRKPRGLIVRDGCYNECPSRNGHYLLTLRCSQNFILGDKRAQRDFDITHMPAVKFIERLGLKEEFSSLDEH
jgi:hypothetical protein